ncbi:cytochrome c3 family protein [Geomonas anaerohicana]|uniref:Cytochrome C n=1 Tax=Geomonas anaerohicana TaxID=2798583 RepID=A0ABS0YGZ0_9BACT|nr:cytochrome c3 family protein [Geomonas anaerohicana]MBJ6751536.1 cytochrome C [Geomonas anaerohicana]
MKRYLLLPPLLVALSALSAAAAENCLSVACHAKVGAYKHPHAPVKGDCLSCHVQKAKEHPLPKAKSFELAAKGSALCATCHDGIGKKKIVHPPVKEGECTSCHNPHGGNGKFLMEADEDRKELCFGCHDTAPFKKPHVHGPVAEGACTACHDPHDSSQKALLKGDVKELCLKCHEDFAKGMKQATRVHGPVKNTPCTSCHDPHSSVNPSLLKEKMPELCIGCHKDIGKKMKSAKLMHQPLTDAKGCGNCHSTHYSSAKGLMAGDQKTICLICHGAKPPGNPPLRDVTKEMGFGKKLHGPIKDSKCDGCHDPHASDYRRLLLGNYPTSLYTPYREGAYDLCLRCHDKNLLRYPDTTLYTKFRNGDRNLHYVHVSNRIKGRSCLVCHESHGADGEKLMNKDGSRFGQWQIKTRLKLTATGGSCAPGCHWAYSYDRVKPVNYATQPQQQPSAPNQKPK